MGLRNRSKIVFVLWLAACSQPVAKAPTPDKAQRPAPDLSNAKVMVFPVQGSGLGGGGVGATASGPLRTVPKSLDDEIGAALATRVGRWIQPREIDRILERSPALSIDAHALAVGSFRRQQVTMIGDPLYGDLRRLGSIFDARYALVPVTAAYVPLADGSGRIEIAAALIDTSGADVVWYGVAAGDNGAPDDTAVINSAARKLAQFIAPARNQ